MFQKLDEIVLGDGLSYQGNSMLTENIFFSATYFERSKRIGIVRKINKMLQNNTKRRN